MEASSTLLSSPTKSKAASPPNRGYWLHSKQWDLTFIILSASLIVLPLVLRQYLGVPRLIVAFGVTLVVGGPHMYSTFTRTFMEKNFIKRHPYLIAVGTVLIPTAVIFTGLTNLTLLMTCFFFWASVHVLHQVIYLVDCYNTKGASALTWKSRLLDYAVVFTSLYPVAFYRMAEGTFAIGSRKMLYPPILREKWFDMNASWLPFLQTEALSIRYGDFVWIGVSIIFGASLILFTIRTIREIIAGVVIWPKVLLIYLSAFAAFVVPTFHDLDVAFQGLNTWHSFQYLGLTWYVNRLRNERGEISLGFARQLSRNPYAYYGLMVALTIAAAGIIFLLQRIGLEYEQSYFITVLSFLLIHYLQDHILFTDVDAVLKKSVAA
jgi:hypothetical protein